MSIEDFDAKPYHVQSVITMLQRAADEKKAELSKKQEDERKKTDLEKKIPLDETEIKTLLSVSVPPLLLHPLPALSAH